MAQAFMFAYSLRERTHAAHNFEDDVPEPVKQRRLAEIIATFRKGVAARNALEVGREHLVLVEGHSKRSTPDNITLTGRTDTNKVGGECRRIMGTGWAFFLPCPLVGLFGWRLRSRLFPHTHTPVLFLAAVRLSRLGRPSRRRRAARTAGGHPGRGLHIGSGGGRQGADAVVRAHRSVGRRGL